MYRTTRVLLSSLMLLVVLFGCHALAWAQQGGATTATLTGVVTDEQGGVIPGVNVSVKNTGTNLTREATTDEQGNYTFLQLPPGLYEITASAEGFATQTSRLELALGTTSRLNFTMQVGATSDIVEVTTTNVIEEAKTEASTNIDSQRINNLPINRRNFLDFSLTAPRVVADRVPAQGAAATSGLSFNGQNARVNNITIDGLDNNDFGTGSVRSTFSQEAVQEFQIVSNSYSAEFGRALGGVVNIVTKGGGNEYHGGLFFLNRNDEISARDVFAPFEANYKQYQFGGTFSGPIKKDKVFFFNSFERLSIKQNNFVTIGDQTVKSARSLGFNLNNGPLPFSLNTTTVLARLDARINNNDTLWVRYNYGGTFNGAGEPFGGLVGDSNAGLLILDDNTLAANNTYVNPGLNLVNETRFIYTRRNQDVLQVEDGPQIRLVAPEGATIFGRSTFLPQPRKLLIYQVVNTTSITRGINNLKFGFDFNYTTTPEEDTEVPIFAGGLGIFNPIDFAAATGIPGLPAFSGLQAFDPSLRTPGQLAFLNLLSALAPMQFPGFPAGFNFARASLPLAFLQGFGDPRKEISVKAFSAFVQNDLKIRPNFTLKLGARYDINRVDEFPDNNGNLSPRVAFSYRPSKLQKLSINAAYGLFFAAPVTGPSFVIGLSQQANPYRLLVLPFPFSAIPFALPGHKFPESTSIPPGVQFIPQLSQIFRFDANTKNSYTQQVSLGFDYLINNTTAISASYQFVRGIRLLSGRNINPIVRPNAANPVLSSITGRVDTTQGDIIQFSSSFDSYFHGATFSINRRLTNRFGFLASYTVSKAIDNFIDLRSDLSEIDNPLKIKDERALSLQDVRQRFVLSGTWELSYTNNPFLRDFQLSSIVTLNSGRPFNLLAGADINRSGDNPPSDRPRIGFTPIGRNAGESPGFANVDLRLTRNIKIGEKVKIQGIAEVFNLFNRVNISEIGRVYPTDVFGNFTPPQRNDSGRFEATPDRFRNAFSPRQFQFGFKLNF